MGTSNYSVSKFYDEETLIEDANANTEDKNDEDYVDKSSKPSPAKKPRKAERRKKDKSTKTNSQNDDLEKIALGCDLCHPEDHDPVIEFESAKYDRLLSQHMLQVHDI